MKSIKNVDVKELIGSGLTSSVYKCISNEKEYALKMFKENASFLIRENEIEALSNLKHDNIISLHKFDQNKEWIMTELLDKRDLFDLISMSNAPFEEKVARNIFLKLAKTVDYFHSEGYVHRDIKLENILVCPKTFSIKLGDFGFAEKIEPIKEVLRCLGTKGYQAPEL